MQDRIIKTQASHVITEHLMLKISVLVLVDRDPMRQLLIDVTVQLANKTEHIVKVRFEYIYSDLGLHFMFTNR